MRRSTIILIIVLAIVAVAAVTVWLTGTRIPNPWETEESAVTNTQTTNTAITNIPTTNTGTTTTNLSVPTEVKGDTVFTATATIENVSLTFSSLQWTNTFATLKAADGKRFLVIYIDPIRPDQVALIATSLSANIALKTSAGDIALRQNKVASTAVTNDRGYLLFEVPTTATGITLATGTGTALVQTPVPLPK